MTMLDFLSEMLKENINYTSKELKKILSKFEKGEKLNDNDFFVLMNAYYLIDIFGEKDKLRKGEKI